jgi:2-amino-4-hydroxy-6-hydroxymethyldihydropteridine diphosphokinase
MGDITDQPDFLNGAVRVETALDPIELLRACKGVEREMGRAPGGLRHGPRPIDVDVLLAGDLTIDAGGLVLPHPETTARRFVLAPLLELDPELALPDGTKLTDALAALEGQRVARIGTL